MIIFPAIDLYGGSAVRLYKGDYARKTVYSSDPVSVALDFRAAGAKYAHLVDLEGAKNGGSPNFGLVCEIKKRSGLFCEIGGGIRDMAAVEKYLSAGVDRVILGTSALTVPGFAAGAVREFGDRIAVGIDIRDGNVAVRGWTEDSGVDAFEFCSRMRDDGVRYLICTDISRDGAMRGTNRELYRDLSGRFDMNITASGGVSSMDDVRALKEMGLYGAIIGKAYYTGDIRLRDAIAITEESSC